jgi:26S proteasome non-ATPase regulatory subunit 5
MTGQGLGYALKHGVVKYLCTMLKETQDDIMVVLCRVPVIKFLGRLSAVHDLQSIEERFHALLQASDLLYSDDVAVKLATIDLVGQVGASLNAPLLVGSPLLDQFMAFYTHAVGDFKVACTQAMSQLMHGDAQGNTYTLLERTLEANPLEYWLTMSKSTLNELRYASYAVYTNMAQHPWGRTKLVQHAAFMRFILDRGTDGTKQGKEYKFAIVYQLSKETTLAPALLSQLVEYVKQGPYYVETEALVAYEGAS